MKFLIFNLSTYSRQVFQFSNHQNGFTLLETLIAVAIFTLILGAIFTFGFDISGFNSFVTENIYSQNELQLTLTAMITEIRSMGPSGVGGYPLESATPSSLVFYSDINRDGLFERVRYYLAGSIFMKGVTIPSGSPLAYNPADEKTTEAVHYVISNPSTIFSYFGKKAVASDPPLAFPINPYLVRSIKVELSSERDPQTGPGPIIFSIFATIRNMRTIQ